MGEYRYEIAIFFFVENRKSAWGGNQHILQLLRSRIPSFRNSESTTDKVCFHNLTYKMALTPNDSIVHVERNQTFSTTWDTARIYVFTLKFLSFPPLYVCHGCQSLTEQKTNFLCDHHWRWVYTTYCNSERNSKRAHKQTVYLCTVCEVISALCILAASQFHGIETKIYFWKRNLNK